MQRSGIALVATLVILVMVLLLVLGTNYTTQIESWVTRNDNTSTTANYIAQAGLQKYKTALYQNYRWALNNTVVTNNSACENVLNITIDWDRSGSGQPHNFSSGAMSFPAENLGGGQYQVTIDVDRAGTPNPGYMSITSVGTFGGAKSTVRAVFNLSNAGLFNYAMVAGTGGGAGVVNGSVNVNGGVFIQGDTNNAANPATNPVFIGSGNMQISNNYSLSNSSPLYNRIAQNSVSNLCASFRVRYGGIKMTGSAGLGTSANPLVDIKIGATGWGPTGSAALVYNNAGNLVTNLTCGAYCANFKGRYDISNLASPTFPLLDDSIDCSGTTKTWRNCMRDETGVEFVRGNPIPTLPTEAGATWDWNPGNNCSSILNQATITFDNTAIDCRFRRNGVVVGGFFYNPSGSNGQLFLYGTVTLKGFDIATSRNISYTANGFKNVGRTASLFVQNSGGGSPTGGNISLGGNFLPDSTTPFPTQTVALLAEGRGANTNAALSLSNNITVAALLYTPRRTGVAGAQTTVAGIVMGDSICTGNANTCNGGSVQIYHVNPRFNLPSSFAKLPAASVPSFQIFSYERY